MSSTRRRFLSGGLALPALAWGCRTTGAAPSTPPAPAPETNVSRAPVRSLLVLGGTRFLGPAVVDAALAANLEVTLFNRGKSDPGAYPQLEALVGDRDPEVGEGLRALEGRRWDAVIDTSGYVPRVVRASAGLLAPSVEQYVFISSVSAYAAHDQPGADETAPLAELEDPTVETMGDQFQNYGGLKVLCEQVVADVFGDGRATNVRPGFIVGPNDPTDRFTYWPWRVAQGGEVLAPGAPGDPIQVIDVRDLGQWLVHLVTSRTAGVFNAVGPEQPASMGEILHTSQEVTGSDARFTWASTEFLQAKGEEGQGPPPLPIWVPPSGDSAGFHRKSNARALAAGLTFRPLEQTIADTLAWFEALPPERSADPRSGPSPEQEKALLAELATLPPGDAPGSVPGDAPKHARARARRPGLERLVPGFA